MKHSISRPWTVVVAVILSTAVLAVAPVGAQEADEHPPYSRFNGRVAFLNTQPLGGLETGPGYGLDLAASWAVDPAHRFRLRGEARLAGYGRDTRTACLSETVGCLIEVDIHTNYSAFYVGAGPEVAVPVLGATLILDATAGIGGFDVTSSVRGISDPDAENLLSTSNFEDRFFAWSAGGALRIPVASQLSISLGGHYQHNGEASYVREGGVTRSANGAILVDARTTDANQMAFTLGLAFHPFVGWTDEIEDGDH